MSWWPEPEPIDLTSDIEAELNRIDPAIIAASKRPGVITEMSHTTMTDAEWDEL